jgi:photosystem II stability/assembly factor-like uncharacterized protein
MEIIMKKLFIILLVFNSVLFSQWESIEINPVNGLLFSFHMSDSLNLTAVFMDDTCYVIKSSDGGKNWIRTQRIPLSLIVDATTIDENHIFARAVYPNQMVFTSDGGVTWSNFTIPVGYVYVEKIQFLNNNTAFASVIWRSGSIDRLHLIKTTDRGVNWDIIDSTLLSYSAFHFKSAQTGWIFGGNIYQTTNGGTSFTTIPIPAGMGVSSADLINDTVMAIGAARWVQVDPWRGYYVPIMGITTNSGVTWLVRDMGDSNFTGKPVNLQFLNPSTVIATRVSDGGLLYTTNFGASWSGGIGPERTSKLNSLKFYNGRCYASGNGILFITSGTDITKAWEIKSDQAYYLNSSAAFLDPGYAIVGDEGGRLYVSTDRGNNWVTRKMEKGKATKINLVNDSLVYLASGNVLHKSENLCRTIDSVAKSPSGSISDISVPGNGTIWISSGTSLFSSSNGGINWETKLTIPGNSFDQVIIFENGTGYASNGKLNKTTDNGTTWNLIGDYAFFVLQICFVNSDFGLILANDGKVYKTTDGAMTISPMIIPGMSYPKNIYLRDSLNIFVNANELYSTYDGGWSWKVNEFGNTPGNNSLLWMIMYDHFEGIGVSRTGIGSGIWKTNNRGNTPVELSAFSAIPLGNKVTLQWTTETETNNMGFEIERRFKNGDWKKIGFSKGHGTATQKIYYTFDDLTLSEQGFIYYRLKQIDYNGDFHYSKEVEVIYGEIPENYAIQQNYPNPFNPSTKVTFSLPEENKVVIRVFNAMGEQVKEIDRGVLSHGYFEQDLKCAMNLRECISVRFCVQIQFRAGLNRLRLKWY